MSKAGKYRTLITVYTPAIAVSDGAGGTIAAGVETSVDMWARVQQMPAKEYLINNAIVYHQPYTITIRATTSMNEAKRIEWNGKRININSVVTDEKNTETKLYGTGN